MKTETNNLISVNTYAKEHNLTTAAVYLQIQRGELQIIKIDGKIFIEKTN